MVNFGRWKTTLREVGWIVILSLVLAGGAYVLRPDAMPRSGLDGDSLTDDLMAQTISLEKAIEHFNNGTAMFADARPLAAFEDGHIKGALHLDPADFDMWSEDLFSQVPSDAFIIAYCEGPRCTLSTELAEKLTWLGYENVYYLKDGWGKWKKNNLPVGKGADASGS